MKWQSIKLDVHTDTSTNNSSVQTKQEGYSCNSDEKSVFSGLLFRVDELKPGEKIDIYFEVVLQDGRESKTELTFTVGEGEKLYLEDVVR